MLKSGKEMEFRTTVVPGLHSEESLKKMAGELKELVGEKEKKWFLQKFKAQNCLSKEYESKKEFSEKEMGNFLKAVKKIYPKAELR